MRRRELHGRRAGWRVTDGAAVASEGSTAVGLSTSAPGRVGTGLRHFVRVRTLGVVNVMQGVLDADLWQAARLGDGAAFAQIFDHHSPRVFRHASRMVGDVHDAEDVTATTFLELWRRREAVRLVEGSLLPWLLVTATNVSRNARRGTRRYRAMLDRLPRGQVQLGPEQEVLERVGHLDPDLLAALRRLRAVDLQIFALVALEGFSISDVAGLLNLTTGAVRNRLHRSRQQLRHSLHGPETMILLEEQ